jgi:hypothetical protein
VSGAPPNDHAQDLLADHATVGLDDHEAAHLHELLSQYPAPGFERISHELAAAAIDLLIAPSQGQALPSAVRMRVEAQAARWLGPTTPVETSIGAPGARIRISGSRNASPYGVAARLGWLAAAAAVLLALAAWWPGTGRGKHQEPDVGAQRQALLVKEGTMLATWGDFNALDSGAVPEVQGVKGDVVYDEAAQTGFMRFVGLPVNDPAKEQYQLWIIDSRGLGQRISGGIFDSTTERELIVPIAPGIRTRGASIFAVTIEQPGGTWVSDMERRVVLASTK